MAADRARAGFSELGRHAALLKRYRELGTSSARRRLGAFTIEGPHLFERMLDAETASRKSPYRLRAALMTRSYMERLERSGRLPLLERLKLQGGIVSESTLERLVDAKTAQGVAAVVKLPDEARAMDERALALSGRRTLRIVLTHGVADPGNAGTLVRTAAAFGAHLLLADGGADLFGPKALRATAGAFVDVPCGSVRDATSLLRSLSSRGVTIVAALSSGGTDLARLKPPGRAVLLLGSEPRGLPAAWVKHAGVRVTVPLHRGVESLNVAVAGGILLYHLSGGRISRRA